MNYRLDFLRVFVPGICFGVLFLTSLQAGVVLAQSLDQIEQGRCHHQIRVPDGHASCNGTKCYKNNKQDFPLQSICEVEDGSGTSCHAHLKCGSEKIRCSGQICSAYPLDGDPDGERSGIFCRIPDLDLECEVTCYRDGSMHILDVGLCQSFEV